MGLHFLIEENVSVGQIVGLVKIHDPTAAFKVISCGISASLSRTKGDSFVGLWSNHDKMSVCCEISDQLRLARGDGS
jgi:hypothetical protein